MNDKLFFIKLVHTAVFIFMSSCLLYVLYCGITKTYNWLLLLAIGALLIEGLALLLNHWRCPITTFAEKRGAVKGSITDTLLPPWIARNVFRVSPFLFAAGLILLAFGYFI
jgi:hypothetical protein